MTSELGGAMGTYLHHRLLLTAAWACPLQIDHPSPLPLPLHLGAPWDLLPLCHPSFLQGKGGRGEGGRVGGRREGEEGRVGERGREGVTQHHCGGNQI